MTLSEKRQNWSSRTKKTGNAKCIRFLLTPSGTFAYPLHRFLTFPVLWRWVGTRISEYWPEFSWAPMFSTRMCVVGVCTFVVQLLR